MDWILLEMENASIQRDVYERGGESGRRKLLHGVELSREMACRELLRYALGLDAYPAVHLTQYIVRSGENWGETKAEKGRARRLSHVFSMLWLRFSTKPARNATIGAWTHAVLPPSRLRHSFSSSTLNFEIAVRASNRPCEVIS